MSTTSGAVGSGSNPQTVARMRAQDAANGGAPGPRQWENGGRIKALLLSIPIATFSIMTACTAVFLWQLTYDEAIGENVICTPFILGPLHEWWRTFSNAWLHVTLFHILFNMMAMYQIGCAVEEAMGTIAVLGHTILFPWLVGGLYLLIQTIATSITGQQMIGGCAVGYSGVIFAFLILEVSMAHLRGETQRSLMGRCQIPILLYPIVILLIISLVLRNVSFLGHVSGIIVGVFYVRGLLQPLTFPRQWCLAIEHSLPGWLTSRPGWRPYPQEDVFKRWEPPCFASAGWCPQMPECANCGGCGWFAQCCRRRQVSGYAAGGPGRQLGGPVLAAGGGAGAARPPHARPHHSSRLVSPVPSAPPAPAPSVAVEGFGPIVDRPPSPSRNRAESVPARPPSAPIELTEAFGTMAESSGGSDGGDYSRLREDDVEAQLLNARNSPGSYSSTALSKLESKRMRT